MDERPMVGNNIPANICAPGEPAVVQLNLRLLEPLMEAVDREAVKAGISSWRWIALIVAERCGIPAEQGVPAPKAMGRPRRRSPTRR
jgi:hypothetical protein